MKRLVLACCLVTAFSTALVVWVLPALQPEEASFSGQGVADWIRAVQEDPTSAQRALLAGAADAVPVLVELLDSPEHLVAISAAQVLYRLGRAAEVAAPALAKALGHSCVSVRFWAMRSLEQLRSISDDSIAALIRALKDPFAGIRESAAKLLGSLGVPAKRCLPALRDSLEDSDPRVCIAAAAAVIRLDSARADAMTVLIEALGPNSRHHLYALQTLENIGSEARAALPHVRTLLTDPDANVQEAAARVLHRLGESG